MAIDLSDYEQEPVHPAQIKGERTCFCGHDKDEHSYAGCHAAECKCVYYAPVSPPIRTYRTKDRP